ncbi:spore germination protein [Petroclostridium sp. X23]|uniref:spore germination protein n=1 Tax=Petroclostridium sp. X23 TaxID=3045146 RepID=UPI0024AD3ED3|nr:spore germination protein [Petroclostridium sp. X23]WHH60841.1 spore germination protein [Petroclostridium sp. X23]
MFDYISKKFRFFILKDSNRTYKNVSGRTYGNPITSDLKKNIEILQNILHNNSDVVVREFNFGHDRAARGVLIYLEGMVNKDILHKNVLQPLMYGVLLLDPKGSIKKS